MTYLTNAFSINMLAREGRAIRFEPVSVERAAELARDAVSAIGHADTAAVVSSVLGFPVACNRANVTFAPGDVMLVAQYSGPRLPEGATALPAGARIEFWLVHDA